MAKDSAAGIELGRSFHQEGTVNEKVCESDFVPLWDGTNYGTITRLWDIIQTQLQVTHLCVYVINLPNLK